MKMTLQEKTSYNRNYKYPYIASEILSHEFPFLTDKIFPVSPNQNPNTTYPDNILCETSITNNSVNDEMAMNNMIVDDVIEDSGQKVVSKSNLQFNPPEIEYNTDKELSLNASLDRKYTMTSSTIKYDEGSLELIDYMFSCVMNNEKMNEVQGGYLVKIVQSFIHLTNNNNNNRGNLFMKYLCFKKKEILITMMNNIHLDYYRNIILEILLYDNTNEDDNSLFEGMKNNLLSYLISLFGVENNISKGIFFYREICDLLSEYIEGSKNCIDYFMNDNLLCSYSTLFTSGKNLSYESLEYLFIFLSNLIKEYKIEYDKSSKFLTSLSKSHMKTTDNKQVDKTILLNLDMDNVLCTKLTNSIVGIKKYFYYKKNIPKSFLIHFLEYINDLVQLTRNSTLLDNLSKEDFFATLTEYFFSFQNDIFQNISISIMKLFLDENLDNWLYHFFISSNFITKSTSDHRTNKYLFIHICRVYELLITTGKTFLVKNNLYDKVNEEFKAYYSNYCDKMNKPLANFKNTFLYMSSIKNESDFEINNVDEVDIVDNSKMKKKASKSHFFHSDNNANNDLIIAEDDSGNDEEAEGNVNDELLLGKISNEDEENFYYDNNYWQHQTKQ